MIEIKNVSKSFLKNKPVLQDISLTVRPGEINGLIGENSSGKTTLLRIMAGIIPQGSGEVIYNNQPVYENRQVKEKIAFIGSNYDYPVFSTERSMCRAYKKIYSDFDEKEFKRILSILEISQNQATATMSTGMKMRLVIALNMARRAPYLLLDEPTLGLDVIVQKKLYELLINKVEEQNTAVLISSHELMQLERICNRVHLLKSGKMILQADTDSLTENYCKVQAVISSDNADAILKQENIIHTEVTGSSYRLIVRGSYESVFGELQKSGIEQMEQNPLTMEELFIALCKEGSDENL